jgi:AcrR family transcriptional regulator
MAAKRASTTQARVGAERRAATAGEVLAATRRLLEAGAPVNGLSVDRIAAEAGVSRATFYLHFRDKYELVSRLADDLFRWREEDWVGELAAPEVERETLERIMRDIVSRWVANQAVLAAIVELAEYDSGIRDAWRGAMDAVARRAAAQFEAHWAGSPARPADPAMIAEVFTWMFERCCHQIARDPRREDGLAEAMAEVIWRVLDYPAGR